jgi:hypothetical protein
MYINFDPTAELAYRREQIAAALHTTRAPATRTRRFRHLPRRATR